MQPTVSGGSVGCIGIQALPVFRPKERYSGVAILTKREPDHVEYGMMSLKYDNEGVYPPIGGDLSIVSVYHPSGTSGDERQAFKWYG